MCLFAIHVVAERENRLKRRKLQFGASKMAAGHFVNRKSAMYRSSNTNQPPRMMNSSVAR